MSVGFTVILPTRERLETLRYSLQTVLEQDYPFLRVVISDNFGTGSTREYVEALGDPRVHYCNPGRSLGMSENFEFALNQVEDGWVLYLGDDDGLVPGSLGRLAQIVEATGCEAGITARCHYFWPGARGPATPPLLTVPINQGYRIHRDVPQRRRAVLQGDLNYAALPNLYTGGFASYRLIREVRERHGKMFRSPAPDVYSALALSARLEAFVECLEPLMIAGISRHSNYASLFGISQQSEPGARHTREGELRYHPLVGEFGPRSLPLLVYDSHLRCAEVDPTERPAAPEQVYATALAWAAITAAAPERQALWSHTRNSARELGFSYARVRWLYPRAWVRQQLFRLRTIAESRTLRELPGAYGAHNVHQGAWAARAVLGERLEGSFWKAEQFWRRLARRIPGLPWGKERAGYPFR